MRRVADGAVVLVTTAHAERVSGLGSGAEGDTLVSASWDGTARRWAPPR